MSGSFLELRDVDITDAGLDQECQVDRAMRNLVADQVEGERLGLAVARHRHRYMRPLGTLQHVGDFGGVHVVGGFAVHRDDDVGRLQACAEGGRAFVGEEHDDLVVLRLDGHAHAVVLAVLVLAHLRVGLRIVKAGVGIENAQHPRNGAIVDGPFGLVAVQRFGVVLLHQAVYGSKGTQVVAQGRLVSLGLGADGTLHQRATGGASGEEDSNGNSGAARTGCHEKDSCGRLTQNGSPGACLLDASIAPGGARPA